MVAESAIIARPVGVAAGRRSPFVWLMRKELRELTASRAYWLLLLVIGALVGHAFMTATDVYAEASGIGGGPAALSQGLSPLAGIVVPTFGAYDIAATLLFPFVAIRLASSEKHTGGLTLMLQAPGHFLVTIIAKGIALIVAWVVAFVPGLVALVVWRGMGGHLDAREVSTVVLGHLLRGFLTIGLGAAAGAFAANAASAAIVALTFTLGTWALDYVAAARGGVVAEMATYTPSAALRVFERGELRASTVLVLIILGVAGLAAASIWLRVGERANSRVLRLVVLALVTGLACLASARVRASWDLSENRQNSFPRADEGALARIREPLRITVYLAAEDPRLTDLERGVLSKLRRTMRDVSVTYAARGRSGLFERPQDHYGEVWYELAGKRAMSRSTTEPIVLETIYELAGTHPATASNEAVYRGYPLAVRASHPVLIFFALWPMIVLVTWWRLRGPAVTRRTRNAHRRNNE
jgi:hypothetical protein